MKYDKFSACMDYFANDGENKSIRELMIRWGWPSKSVVYRMIKEIKNGSWNDFGTLNNLADSYLKAVKKRKWNDKKNDVKQPIISVPLLASPVGDPQKEPLFPDVPGDTGLQYPINTVIFKNIWAMWIEYKRTEKNQRYKTLKSEQIAINKLADDCNFDENVAIEMIKQAISGTWMGWARPKRRFNKKKEKITIIDNPTPEDTEWSTPTNQPG